jgi:NADP-dependent 3-hydroxy acid dehydrogenase YdfG
MSSSSRAVWLITGCSSGFGQAIAREALCRGEQVVAASRRLSSLKELRDLGAATLALNVCDTDEVVSKAVVEAHSRYGRLDILVNNAGYILEGTVEACSSDEVAAQFEVNVFGALRVTRAVLPYLRAQRAGVVCNMGSIGGWRGTPVGGLYCATKWALAGVTQSLKAEVQDFGIEVVIVEPGWWL